MRVLLAGLPAHLARDLMAAATAAGAVAIDCSLDDAALMVPAEAIDVVVLNPRARDGAGARVAAELRGKRLDISLVMLAERSLPAEEIRWLTLADDVVEPDRDPGVVLAKLRAIERRRLGHASNRIAIGDVLVDLDRRQVSVAGRDVLMEAKVYAIMELLALRAGRFVHTDAIIEAVWPAEAAPIAGTVQVYVYRLRRALEQAGAVPGLIRTSRNRGWLIERGPTTDTRRAA